MTEVLKVLLVEDNPPDACLVKELLKESKNIKFETTEVTRLGDVFKILPKTSFDIVLLDLTLPDAMGLETLRRMLSFAPDIPVVVLTGHEDETLGLQAIQSGAQDYLPKRKVEPDLLRRAIRYAIQRKRSEQMIQKLAHFDTLTSLPNRQLFFDRFQQLLIRAQRETFTFGIYFIDLDGFKEINDRMGHDAGDEVLKKVAHRLSCAVREEDTVARFGGDEFTVLVPDVGDEKDASTVAEKIHRVFDPPISVMGDQVQLTLSMGVVLYPRDGRDVKTLLQRADTAMYAAKRKGTGQYRLFQKSLNLENHADIQAKFRRAMEKDEFEVMLQPRIDLALGCVKSAEALLRWKTAERGILFPGDFLDMAEKHGQMELIGKWMLTKVVSFLQRSQADQEQFSVSVNLSPMEILREGFSDDLHALCTLHGVPPSALELELTESQVVPNWKQTVAVLGQLRRSGFRIAMDDFGSGYASLDYLIRQSFDVLKLDRCMIKNVPENLSDSQIVRSVISLCRRIGLVVVAEGVERRAQLSFLRRVGCGEVQGYLLGKPMSPARVPRVSTIRQR